MSFFCFSWSLESYSFIYLIVHLFVCLMFSMTQLLVSFPPALGLIHVSSNIVSIYLLLLG